MRQDVIGVPSIRDSNGLDFHQLILSQTSAGKSQFLTQN